MTLTPRLKRINLLLIAGLLLTLLSAPPSIASGAAGQVQPGQVAAQKVTTTGVYGPDTPPPGLEPSEWEAILAQVELPDSFSPGRPNTKVVSPDGFTMDRFGFSVALSETTLAVGVPYDDVDANADQGSVYLFGRNHNGPERWGFLKRLNASDGAAGDHFGYSLAFNTTPGAEVLVVGAEGDTVGANAGQGSAYVFYRYEGGFENWGEVQKLTASDGHAGDGLGSSAAAWDNRVVLGAAHADGPVLDQGAAYVFNKDLGGLDNWGQEKKLIASDGSVNDQFGFSLSMYSDWILVGAPYDDFSGNLDQGSAYLYQRNYGGTNNWGELRHLNHLDGQANDLFGYSVSINEDILVVGAPLANAYVVDQGSAYVHRQDLGGLNAWGLQRKLSPADGETGDFFGGGVVIDHQLMIVSAPLDVFPPQLAHGSAYPYMRNKNGINAWGQLNKVYANDSVTGDAFGTALALRDDILAVGVPLDDLLDSQDQGSAYILPLGRTEWSGPAHLVDPAGAANDQYGYSIAIHADTLVIGVRQSTVGGVILQGAAYVFERNIDGGDNWGLVKQIVASDGLAGDRFGSAVATNGMLILVGAPDDDETFIDQGSAYVFMRDQGGARNWGEVKKLTASDGAQDDHFGSAVGLGGDAAAVGSPGNNAAQGSFYIYRRNQSGAENWGEITKVVASDGVAGDMLGSSLALDGNRLVAGAMGKDTFTGGAYVFYRNQGGADHWGEVRKLVASDGAPGDRLGLSVALSGNWLVAGAPNASVSGTIGQGAVYLYELNHGGANNWGEVKKFVAYDGQAGDGFGWSAALYADRLLVGAIADDVGGNADQGSAYVYERNRDGADAWGLMAHLVAPEGQAVDYFGLAVGLSGNTLLVGAPADDVNGIADQGSAYLFTWQGNRWALEGHPVDPAGTVLSRYGYAVATNGDIVAIGAPWQDSGGLDQGIVYVLERNQGGIGAWGIRRTLLASDGAALDYFGWSLALSGDTLIVGAPYDDVGANSDQGSAYIFERNRGGANQWGQSQKLVAADGASLDYLGWQVSVSGDHALAGAPGDDLGAAQDQGSAYLFQRNLGGAENWGEHHKLIASDGASGDDFGVSVAISGDSLLVGADSANLGAKEDQGAVYAFERNKDGADMWGQTDKLVASDGAAFDYFGNSLSMDDNHFIAGAPKADLWGTSDAGAAYVFSRIMGNINMSNLSDWGQRAKLVAPDYHATDYFGTAVAIHGNRAVVGADGDDIASGGQVKIDQGSAYLFERNVLNTDSWTIASKLVSSNGHSYEYYGAPVAIFNDTMVVGAYVRRLPITQEGSVYIYRFKYLNIIYLPLIY
jgi:hypothetical protein